MINAVFYMVKVGGPWRLLPHTGRNGRQFTITSVVGKPMVRGRKYTTFCELKSELGRLRKVEPSAGIADTQSVKAAGNATEVGFDGGKMILGRKRHIVVDTLGLLLGVFVHSAGRSEQAGFKLLLQWFTDFWPRLQLLWVDSSYRGAAFTLVGATNY